MRMETLRMCDVMGTMDGNSAEITTFQELKWPKPPAG